MKKGCLLCQESHFLLSTNRTHDDLYHPLTYKSHRFKAATFLVIVVLIVVVVVVLSACEVKMRGSIDTEFVNFGWKFAWVLWCALIEILAF